MKKPTIYTILSIMVVSMFLVSPATNVAAADPVEFSYGVGSLCVDLDPHQAWDSASIDVIDQVCEGLFTYNLSDPELPVIPRLATTFSWNTAADELTVNLRDDVTFHDDSTFTADDVKYSFDRLNNLILIGESQLAELYEPLAGIHPDTPLVINETVVVSDYVVKFKLNYPYVAFIPLLCFSGSVILPKDVYNASELMNIASDVLIGTGPFKYIEQTAEMTTMHAYEDYYLGKAHIDRLYWVLYNDATAKNQAFLTGDLDWLDGASPEFLAQYEADPNFALGDPLPSTVIQYMGMNNKQISKPYRQAISYAIDYNYIINEILKGNAVRMTSPVPTGILYHVDCEVATYNVTHARKILIDAGLSHGLTAANTTAQWQAMASNNPIATYNYTWNTGNKVRADLGILVANNLYSIGIKVDLEPMTWGEYLTRLLGDFDKLQLYMIGWGPDYNDPSNFINPLFSNTSHSNGAQVNDPWLQDAMMDALTITDPVARRAKYEDIQEYVVEDLMPWVFLTTGIGRGVRRADVFGIQRNSMSKIAFYTIYFGEAPVDTADKDGIPGYSLIAMIGVAAITVSALIYKKRQ